jgi:spore germination cell wall hydrolase CwlJ-like protein
VNAPIWIAQPTAGLGDGCGQPSGIRTAHEVRRRFVLPQRRSARSHLVAVAGLTLILLVALAAWWRTSDREPEAMPSLADLAQFERLRAPNVVPPFGVDPAPLQGEMAAQRNAAMPFASLGPAAKPFRFSGTARDRARARVCLAAAMFYEAGDDGIGQLAVGQVVLNRLRHPAFPAAVCGVVLQGSERATGYQSTFTCDGALARRTSAAARARALAHADLMLDGLVFAGVGLATHYHTDAVYPWWSPKLEKIARVGPHLFFRWPGSWGSARAVVSQRAAAEPPAALFASFAGDAVGIETLAPAHGDDGGGPTIALALPSVPSREGAGPTVSMPADAISSIPASRRLSAVQPAIEPAAPVLTAEVLGGNRLLAMFPQEGVFYLELARGSSESGRRRVAELLCGGRSACRVYGWGDAAEAPRGPEFDASAQSKAAFAYVRRPGKAPRASLSAAGPM